ncbi:Nitrogen permease regulator 2 [Dinochytrium kinnereticum]|nr:Nitrogen permease regulator 2 [Dinochytrium kinnereticum]
MSKNKHVDDETIDFLNHARDDDKFLVDSITLDRKDIEFKHGHAERLNNFRTDELYIERANVVEAAFLTTLFDEEYESLLARQAEEIEEQNAIESDRKTFVQIMNEMKDLKLQCLQNKAAADMLKSSKKTHKERRTAVRDRLSRLEVRQERERKSLAEAHARQLKDMKLSRNLTLLDIEDPELRIITAGNDFNSLTLAAENAKMNAHKNEQTRIFNAKIFAQLVRNTKEIEQLREIHLLKLKHTTKYCDTELESIDEFEALISQQANDEQKLEAELKAIADKAEATLNTEMTNARVKSGQRETAQAAAIKRVKLKAEAKHLRKQQSEDAKKRQKAFWEAEEELLREHLNNTSQSTEGKNYEIKVLTLLDRSRTEHQRLSIEHELGDSDLSDADSESIKDSAARMEFDATESEKQFARDAYKIENMRRAHQDQVRKLKHHNSKIRENIMKAQQKMLKELNDEQDIEVEKLKEQQEKEMKALIETQKTSEKVDEDNKALNDRLNAMLPRFVVDTMKRNEPVVPKEFNDLIFLTSDLVSFTSLSSESSATQVISLLNRLYSAMDETLDSFHDVFKLETIGDAYCVVAGLNSQERSPRMNAIDVIECALSFIEIVEGLDMTDQIKDKLEMRIGVHCGPAVGGVANVSQPKFSLFGDTVTATGLLEQSSKPNAIHVSGPTYDLVKDDYDFDVSESITIQSTTGQKKKVATYWLIGRKGNAKIDGGRADVNRLERTRSGSRNIHFSQ